MFNLEAVKQLTPTSKDESPMNSDFKFKLLQNLSRKKAEGGFTLIELLVVVIIIGVLAAIALPNLLGQVGKARESEAKNVVGALNRAQQAYFTERAAFATSTDTLEVPTGTEKYYSISVSTTQNATNPLQFASGTDNGKNGTRDYIGAVNYSSNNRTFTTNLYRGINKATSYVLVPGTSVKDAGVDLTATYTTAAEVIK